MSDDIRVPRFYIQHGVIHDNVTGKHVTCDPDTRTLEGCGPNGEDVVHKNPDGITSTLDLLNGLCRHETSELAASLITCAESRCECCDGWLDEAERLMREATAALLAAPPAAKSVCFNCGREFPDHSNSGRCPPAAQPAVMPDGYVYETDSDLGVHKALESRLWNGRAPDRVRPFKFIAALDTQTAQPDSALESADYCAKHDCYFVTGCVHCAFPDRAIPRSR